MSSNLTGPIRDCSSAGRSPGVVGSIPTGPIDKASSLYGVRLMLDKTVLVLKISTTDDGTVKYRIYFYHTPDDPYHPNCLKHPIYQFIISREITYYKRTVSNDQYIAFADLTLSQLIDLELYTQQEKCIYMRHALVGKMGDPLLISLQKVDN